MKLIKLKFYSRIKKILKKLLEWLELCFYAYKNIPEWIDIENFFKVYLKKWRFLF